MNKEFLKILKWMVLICIFILLFEGCCFLYNAYQNKKNSSYFDCIHSYEYQNDFYVAVGVNNNNDKKLNKAKVTKYNANNEKVWETLYNQGYNGEFLGVAIDFEDIIAVGSYEKNKDEYKKGTTTAILVKYDSEGKILFQQDLQLLGDSRFNKVLVVDDGYIVVGQSIYEDKTLGAPQGGAVLVKYNKDGKLIWKTNYGSSKTASYNNVMILNNKIYAIGKDSDYTGIISIYTEEGDRIDTKYYEGLNSDGFVGISHIDNNIYVTGTKLVNDNTDGVIVQFDLDGDLTNEVLYSGRGEESFNTIITDNNNLVVIGNMSVYNKKASDKKKKVYDYYGIIGKYKSDLTKVDVLEYGDLSEDFFTDVKLVDHNYLVSGYSSYEDDGYLSKFIKYSDALKVLEVK